MKELRSQAWFGPNDFHGFIHRGWLKNQGWPADLFEGKPVVGICNTWSELTPAMPIYASSPRPSSAVSGRPVGFRSNFR